MEKQKNNYVIGLKKNQLTLYNKVEENFVHSNANKIKTNHVLEKNKGRLESRRVSVLQGKLNLAADWKNIKSIIMVERETTRKKDYSYEISYYVSNLKKSAEWFQKTIRDHWKIENQLHYTKDVSMKEDASKIRTGNAPQNVTILRNVAFNLHKATKHTSIRQSQRMIANDIKQIINLLITT